MSEEIESRKLTNQELRAQIDRIVALNEKTEWSEREKREYHAAINSISTYASKKTMTMRGYLDQNRKRVYKYIKQLNGELKKDEQTIIEEEMEKKYEEKEAEERKKELEEKERNKEIRREKRTEFRKNFFKKIVNFFRNIKNGIIKRLAGKKENLTLDKGRIEEITIPNQREEFVEQLREGVGKDKETDRAQSKDKNERKLNYINNKKEKDER